MEWCVNYTSEFEKWWDSLSVAEQEDTDTAVILLQKVGPSLSRPHADAIHSSKYANMKELIIQHAGKPYRVFYAFDPRREAILLIGGCKTGDKRFYKRFVAWADRLYGEHLESLRMEQDSDR